MEKISKRKETILRCLIESFIKSPDPVGSKKIQQDTVLSVSTATIRSEMNELEGLGFITHPHTSAGRIPTDLGYRYYVDRLMGSSAIGIEKIQTALSDVKQKMKSLDDFLTAASKIISTFTNQVGVVVFPALDDLLFRNVHLVPLGGRRVLVVWATMSGDVREQIVMFDQKISDAELKQITNFMNEEFVGVAFHMMQGRLLAKLSEIRSSYREIYQVAEQIIQESMLEQQKKKVCIDGVSRVLEYPEFQDMSEARPLFELMENSDNLIQLLDMKGDEAGAQVTIGAENDLQDLRNCSILKQQYSINDQVFGTVSIIGPKRMHYANMLAMMNVISNHLSESFRDNPFG